MTLTHVIETVQVLTDALAQAEAFIKNGVALGFIRMPDADCPDSAHETPRKISAALTSGRALLAQMQMPRDAAMRAAAQATMLGVVAGRSAFREGKPRHEMQNPFEFIGWDEAEYCAGEER